MKKRKHRTEFEHIFGSDFDSDDSTLDSDLDSELDSDFDSDLESDLQWASSLSTGEERENGGQELECSSIISTGFSELDDNLWGNLGRHLNLAENIYSRLPFGDLFELRTVCKDWHRVACKRLALKERTWKPIFLLCTEGANGRLDGTLAYNFSSKSWDWKWRQADHDPDCLLVSLGSLVYSTSGLRSPKVYDWEDQASFVLPQPPVVVTQSDKAIIGMSRVYNDDGSFRFKVVLGSEHFDTLVYDSETQQWKIKPCRPEPKTPGDMQVGTGCVQLNGRVYITTKHRREIFVYDSENVMWSSINSPLKWVATRNLKKRQHACLDTLGTWNGRVFDVTVSSPAYEYYDLRASRPVGRLSVWELLNGSEWRLYDCMPKDMYAWLRYTEGFPPLFDWKTRVGHVTIHASFCGDYVLVYSWNYVMGEAGRFCLYDMAFKNWQKLQIPMGTVGFAGESESEFVPSSLFGMEKWNRNEIIDPLDEDELLFQDSDMSDSELDIFLEEHGYESDSGSF